MSREKKVKEPIVQENYLIDFSEKNCGYVMPISDTSDYCAGHWRDVENVLKEVTNKIGFKESRVVSSGLDVTTIHKRIVNNLYHDDIIICDVSSRNPNVMFELGMRIAFDKPVVIIKDDSTPYCFDSGTIEHLEYPKDMRYSSIEDFKNNLEEKVRKTLEVHLRSPEISPILQSFGSFKPVNPNLPELSEADTFRAELAEMKFMMRNLLENERYSSRRPPLSSRKKEVTIPLEGIPNQNVSELLDFFSSLGIFVDKLHEGKYAIARVPIEMELITIMEALYDKYGFRQDSK